MKRTLASTVLATVMVLTCACGGSTTSTPATTPNGPSPQLSAEDQNMIATMDQFLRDPGAGDPRAIMSFVIKSPAVQVVIDQRLVWPDPRLPDGADALLVAGFAAGSARRPPPPGVKRDSPVEGVR